MTTLLADPERQELEARRFAKLDEMWRRHGTADEWVLCPHMMRNGDFFIALSLLHEFRHLHGGGRPIRLLVTDEKQAALASMFADRVDTVRQAGVLTSLPIAETMRWMETRGLDRFGPGGLLMMQPWSFTRASFHLNSFITHGHAFYSSMMAMVLRLHPNTALSPAPVTEQARQHAVALAAEAGVAPGRSLILFPYAQSFRGDWQGILQVLAERAKAEGLVVLTSCVPGREEPIAGTEAVDIPFPLLRPFCEHAGFAVSARSGISDMLARIRARHVVIYDRTDLARGWSLRALGWGGDAAEIVLEPGQFPEAEAAGRIWDALLDDADAAQPCALPFDIDSFLALSPLALPAGANEARTVLGLSAPHARFRGLIAHPGIVLAEGWYASPRLQWTYGTRSAFHLRCDAAIAAAAREGRARLVLRGQAAVSANVPELTVEVRLGKVAHAHTFQAGKPAVLDLPLPRAARLDEALPCEILIQDPPAQHRVQGRGNDRRLLGFGISELLVRVEG